VLLPNADRAVVDAAKVRDYLLSHDHPVGQHKAVFFEALGFRARDWHVLRDALLQMAGTEPAVPTQRTEHGQKYEVRGTLRAHPFRRAQVVTVWMVRNNEDFPRLVTAYPESP
jgi:hypothetical protein